MKDETTIITWAIAIRSALNAQNLPADELFTQAGLDISQLQDPSSRYPVSKMSALWELATDASGDPSFPLAVPQHVQPGTLHGLGLAMMASDTLKDALKRLERFSHIVSTAANIVTHQEGKVVAIEFIPTCTVARHAVEAFIATTTHIARLMLHDPNFTASRVELRSPKPADAAPYDQFFNCDVCFDQPRWAVVIDASVLDLPIPLANSAIAIANDSVVSQYLAELEDNIVDKTRQAILDELASGQPTIDIIAPKMNLSARSLQRQLSEAKQSFTQLRESVQRELAQSWLANSDRSLAEITFRSGFNDQSNFSKAFKRWTGLTPGEYRVKNRT